MNIKVKLLTAASVIALFSCGNTDKTTNNTQLTDTTAKTEQSEEVIEQINIAEQIFNSVCKPMEDKIDTVMFSNDGLGCTYRASMDHGDSVSIVYCTFQCYRHKNGDWIVADNYRTDTEYNEGGGSTKNFLYTYKYVDVDEATAPEEEMDYFEDFGQRQECFDNITSAEFTNDGFQVYKDEAFDFFWTGQEFKMKNK